MALGGGDLDGSSSGVTGSSGTAALEQLPELGDACRAWAQGDVFGGVPTFAFDHLWRPQQRSEQSAAIVSQTCDASLPNRRIVQIAPVVELTGSIGKEASAGKRPRYVPLSGLGPSHFVDLEVIVSVDKAALLQKPRRRGLVNDQHRREFAFAVARKFGRFAFPDEVVRCFEPLVHLLQRKARKDTTSLGKVLAGVHSIRIHCEDWSRTPYELTLIVLLEAGILPAGPDDFDEVVDLSFLEGPAEEPVSLRVDKYVDYLASAYRTEGERQACWYLLADGWAAQCENAAWLASSDSIIGSVRAEVDSVDIFPYSRAMITEGLDLDYLCDSRKTLT
ncbi:hypothetical protein ACWEVD_09775 [Nocardia thailandica]|uniref:hypothetical protein n=1 Tax=Nocardia thailandica TaxID=257275 RepID=UPI0002DC1DE9|nr:hypothetical protein [Nocardia thailandica]